MRPTGQVEKILWWNCVSSQRLNERVYGYLTGKALRQARKVVDSNGMINVSGEYGSIEIDEKDFHPFVVDDDEEE
jgi:bisphosphoglycerate-dependent phosphoglycerate mutase